MDITLEQKIDGELSNVGWSVSNKTNSKYQHSLSKFFIYFWFLVLRPHSCPLKIKIFYDLWSR